MLVFSIIRRMPAEFTLTKTTDQDAQNKEKDAHVCDDKGKEVEIITMIKLNEVFLGHFTGVLKSIN